MNIRKCRPIECFHEPTPEERLRAKQRNDRIVNKLLKRIEDKKMSETGWQLAAKAVQNTGMKIRRRAWSEFDFIFFDGRKWMNENNKARILVDFDDDDWQEYTEPKKERKTRVEKRYVRAWPREQYILLGEEAFEQPQDDWDAFLIKEVHIFEEIGE